MVRQAHHERSVKAYHERVLEREAPPSCPPATVSQSSKAVNIVIPAKAGIQNMLKILDSPVSSTGQAQSRALLARNDQKVITTQSPKGDIRGSFLVS